MCESYGVKSAVYASRVMTIREKLADLSYLVSKYKDNHMALSFFYRKIYYDTKI